MDHAHVFIFHFRISVFLNLLLVIFISTLNPTEVYFNGEQYLHYTPSKQPVIELTNMNRIHLEFRTIHSTGILVVMRGKGNDVLVLQLVNGGLRYLISRTAHKHMEYSIGLNLDDNRWHSVNILRTETLNEFILDNQTKISLSPHTYKTISVNQSIYIGGGWNNDSLIPYLRPSHNIMYRGCLKLLKIDNRDPISYFRDGNNRVKVLPEGRLRTNCSDSTSPPISLSKTWSSLDIKLSPNNVENILKLNASVRTFSRDGKILSTVSGNFSLDVGINASYIYLKLWKNEELIYVMQTRESISGGAWHDLFVLMTNNTLSVVVDQKLYTEELATFTGDTFLNPTQIYLGTNKPDNEDNFIGCLHDIKFNDVTLDVVIPTNKLKEIHHSCKLKCSPNPCQNNGLCTRDKEDYRCDCNKTNFYGKHCEIYKYKTSCAEYRQMGLLQESFCLIDADGTGELAPYTTVCNFSNNGEVYTSVQHNHREEFDAKKGGYMFPPYQFHRLKYEVDFHKIDSLIARSTHCRQRVVLKCMNVVLFNAPDGPSNIGWESRDSHVKEYWGGVKDEGHGCACGVDGTCNNKMKLCNCDQKESNWTEDSGYLTDKRYLPVTRLRVTGIGGGSVMVYVGPLECFSKKTKSNVKSPPKSVLNEVCMSVTKKNSLLESANFSSGNYLEKEADLPTPPPETSFIRIKTTTVFSPNRSAYLIALRTRSLLPPRTFGVLEIVVLSFAGLAFIVLVVKYICCDRFCKRNDRGELILNQVSDCCLRDEQYYESVGSRSADGTMTKNNGIPHVKVTRNPLSAYWV